VIPPRPAAVRQYFDRRRRAHNPDKGLAPDERQFNDVLWAEICHGAGPHQRSSEPVVVGRAAADDMPEADAQNKPVNAATLQQTPTEPGADGSLAVPTSVTPKIAASRPCATCSSRHFRPWRPQDAYCSSPCRQKAYRQRLTAAASPASAAATLQE
jgi:hypothetical protein